MNIGYLGRELSHRPRRTLAAVASVAVGMGLLLTLTAYSRAYQTAARAPLSLIGADLAAQRQGNVPEEFRGVVFPHSTAPIHRHEIEGIKAVTGVEEIGEAVLFWDFGEDHFWVALGLDPRSNTGPARLRSAVTGGRFFEAGEAGVAVADATFAEIKRMRLNSPVQIGGRAFTLIGFADTSRIGQVANANLYIPVADARRLAYAAKNVRAVHDFRPDDANILFIRANQAQAEKANHDIGALLGTQAFVSSAQSFGRVLDQAYGLVNLFGILVGLAGLLTALVGLLRSLLSALRERRRDIALMRVVGWGRAQVVGQLTAEAAGLSAIGSLIGSGLAALASLALSLFSVSIPVPWELSPTPHFTAGGAVPMGVTISLGAGFDPLTAALAVVLTIVGGSCIGFLVARRAIKIKPAEVLRNE